jgi:hypothetical protein
LEKWIFQFGIGLSPVLQYRPKPTRTAGPSAIFPSARTPGRCSDRAAVGSDRAQRDSASSRCCSDRCQLPSASMRHTCSSPCAALRADVRTLVPRVHDCCSAAHHLTADAADQLPPPLHALHVQPSAVHPTPSQSVRRKKPFTPFSPVTVELPPLHSSCHRRRASATVDRRLWSSSGHTCSTPSTARVPGTSTPTSTPASTPSPVCRRRLFPARARRRGELPTVSLPPPFASNQSHHHPGPLPGYFPTDQRWPADRISPRRGGGGGFPSPVSSAGLKHRGNRAV